MAKVYVYSGLPGSGKSTVIKEKHPRAAVFSADNYFMVLGAYEYDPTKIGLAHADCFLRFIEQVRLSNLKAQHSAFAIGAANPDIVVDNTNTTVMEISPYMLAAAAYGLEAEVITVKCDPRVALDRNTHGVPWEAQCDLLANLNARELPPWWKHTEIESQ
jgi:adenylate kinase